MFLSRFFKLASHDMAIDLGTERLRHRFLSMSTRS